MPWPSSILTTTPSRRHHHPLLCNHLPCPDGVRDAYCQLRESEFMLWLAGYQCTTSYRHFSSYLDRELHEKCPLFGGHLCTFIDSISFPHWPQPTKWHLPYSSRFQFSTSNSVNLDKLRDDMGHQGLQGSKDLCTDAYQWFLNLFVP